MASKTKVTNKKVTEKEKKFFDEYLKSYNMAAAYKIAFPDANPTNPSRQAARLMAKPHCIAYLKERKKAIQKKTDYNQQKWFGELEQVAHANLYDYIDLETGTLKPDTPRELFANVKKININRFTNKDGRESVTVTVELYDKLKALETIGKHMDFLHDSNTNKAGDINIHLGTAEALKLMTPKEPDTIDISHEEAD